MKKLILMGISCISITVWRQQNPTINNPVNGGVNNGNFWSRAGNAAGTNNIFVVYLTESNT